MPTPRNSEPPTLQNNHKIGKDGDYVAELSKVERRMFVGDLLNIAVQRSDYSIIL